MESNKKPRDKTQRYLCSISGPCGGSTRYYTRIYNVASPKVVPCRHVCKKVLNQFAICDDLLSLDTCIGWAGFRSNESLPHK